MILFSDRLFKVYLTFFSIFIFFIFPASVEALTLTPIRFELEVNPGETISRDILLKNEEEEGRTYYVSYANFEASGESGTPTFEQPVDGIGTWITTESSIYVPNEGETIIPFSISVPQNAEPGGYFGTIFFGTNPSENQGGQVSVGSKIGVLVLLTVRGDIKEDGGVIEFDTVDNKRFFTSLPISFFYRFQNLGRDRVKPQGEITIRNFFVIPSKKISANNVEGNILPTQIRRFEAVWSGSGKNANLGSSEVSGFFSQVKNQWHNFAFGYYTAKLDITFGATEQHAKDRVSFWVIPWQFLIVFSIVIFAVYRLFRFLIKKYNEKIIKQASLRYSEGRGRKD